MTKYDFLDNNFTVYEPVKEPKKVVLNWPLTGEMDVTDKFQNVTKDGIPIVKNNISSDFIINNNQEPEISTNKAYSVNTSIGDKKKLMDFFISKKLKPYQVAGIIGNLMQESDLNTKAIGDGGKSFGLAQWNQDRLDGLKEFAKSRKTDISDLDTQLEYVWKELNSSHKKALDSILNSKSVEEATTNFMKYYEKPGNPQLENRIKNAKSLVKEEKI